MSRDLTKMVWPKICTVVRETAAPESPISHVVIGRDQPDSWEWPPASRTICTLVVPSEYANPSVDAPRAAQGDGMTPAKFMAAFCDKTGAHLSVCGATKPLSWEAALEIIAFGYKLVGKPREDAAAPPPSGSVPEVTAADVAYLQGLLAESERTQGARVLDRTMYAIERACLSRILAAVSAWQGRAK